MESTVTLDLRNQVILNIFVINPTTYDTLRRKRRLIIADIHRRERSGHTARPRVDRGRCRLHV